MFLPVPTWACLQQTRESITATDAKISEVCRRLAGYESLISIPGVGPVVAATVLAAIGDPHRFSNAKQVVNDNQYRATS